MATSVAIAYANTVKKNQRVLFGVWEPGLPVQLGDYGTMNGNIFVPQGNIREFEDLKDFKITIRKDNSQDEKTFTSENPSEETFEVYNAKKADLDLALQEWEYLGTQLED